MKRRIYSVAVMLILGITYLCAQNNLQFKEAKFYEYAGTLTSPTAPATFTLTVPDSTVLKIESASVSQRALAGHYTLQNYLSIDINDKVLFEGIAGGGNYTNNVLHTQFPIWLPAGNYTLAVYFNTNNSSADFKAYVSGLEFKVVPQ